jgi:hypothetical protein
MSPNSSAVYSPVEGQRSPLGLTKARPSAPTRTQMKLIDTQIHRETDPRTSPSSPPREKLTGPASGEVDALVARFLAGAPRKHQGRL